MKIVYVAPYDENPELTSLIMNWVVAEGADPTGEDCSNFAKKIMELIKGDNK